MSLPHDLDCVIVGYNETPFNDYEEMLRLYGKESAAYRDLQLSFVDLGDQGGKLDYVGLLNHVCDLAGRGRPTTGGELRSGDLPNLAAVYLTNFLWRRGYRASYINLFQHEKDRLARQLERRPLCVVLTTTFYVVNSPVKEIVDFVRRHNEETPIVVGGPLIANHFRRFEGHDLRVALEEIGADVFVNDSQGESTLGEIIRCLRNGGDLAEVSNLAYFEDDSLRVTPRVPEDNSLDENYIDWQSFAEQDLGPTIQTRTARSCAFRCAFCGYPTRAGKLALVGLETLERELDSIRRLNNVSNVVFIDDTFNVPLKRFKRICRLMIDKDYGFDWFSYFRCGNADEEAVELMAQSGCKGVFLGIESGSPMILKNMHKAATIEKYANGIEWLRRHGILTFGSFIVGFPGETQRTVDETIRFIDETRLDYYRAQAWYAEAGAPIDLQREEYGITGQGFNWRHETMNSAEAMDQIDRMFFAVKNSVWLPQWSFDFWIIPHLAGRGVSPDLFRRLMVPAHELLRLELRHLPPDKKCSAQRKCIDEMVGAVRYGAGERRSPLRIPSRRRPSSAAS